MLLSLWLSKSTSPKCMHRKCNSTTSLPPPLRKKNHFSLFYTIHKFYNLKFSNLMHFILISSLEIWVPNTLLCKESFGLTKLKSEDSYARQILTHSATLILSTVSISWQAEICCCCALSSECCLTQRKTHFSACVVWRLNCVRLFSYLEFSRYKVPWKAEYYSE